MSEVPHRPMTADLDLQDLAEVQRRVVGPVIAALFRPGEVVSAVIRAAAPEAEHLAEGDAPALLVDILDRDKDLTVQPFTAEGPRWADAAEVADNLGFQIETWISQTTYAWGEDRTWL